MIVRLFQLKLSARLVVFLLISVLHPTQFYSLIKPGGINPQNSSLNNDTSNQSCSCKKYQKQAEREFKKWLKTKEKLKISAKINKIDAKDNQKAELSIKKPTWHRFLKRHSKRPHIESKKRKPHRLRNIFKRDIAACFKT